MSRDSFHAGEETWTVRYDRPVRTFYAQVGLRRDHTDDADGRAAFLQRHPSVAAYGPDDLLLTVAGELAAGAAHRR